MLLRRPTGWYRLLTFQFRKTIHLITSWPLFYATSSHCHVDDVGIRMYIVGTIFASTHPRRCIRDSLPGASSSCTRDDNAELMTQEIRRCGVYKKAHCIMIHFLTIEGGTY
eukprot:scaffold2072_cov98-Cylindrotheca_fusiformis.AAC.3